MAAKQALQTANRLIAGLSELSEIAHRARLAAMSGALMLAAAAPVNAQPVAPRPLRFDHISYLGTFGKIADEADEEQMDEFESLALQVANAIKKDPRLVTTVRKSCERLMHAPCEFAAGFGREQGALLVGKRFAVNVNSPIPDSSGAEASSIGIDSIGTDSIAAQPVDDPCPPGKTRRSGVCK
jgi:hypothetical protein